MLKRFFSLSFVYLLVLRTFAIELDFQDQIAEGEKYYVELQKISKSEYGACWKDAMSDLYASCKELTEDVQSRLALSFANCFLKQAGIDPCLCTHDDIISSCLKNCSDRVFNTYAEFFTHVQSVCHYLQHKEWQVEMARTALLLTKNSQKISQKLQESAQSQSKILHLQRTALTEQKKSIANGQILNLELVRSRENARDLHNEFKATTHEQRLLLFEIFDQMKNLQNFVLGEFTGVYTAAYYLVVAVLVYILTSMPKTADARIWLILTISVNAALEKALTSCILQGSSMEVNPVFRSELLYGRIWLCRKVASLVCIVILIVTYYRYKDYNVINNELLREIQQQNLELQIFIKGLTLRDNFLPAAANPLLLVGDRKITLNDFGGEKQMDVQVSPQRDAQEKKENTASAVSLHDLKITSKRKTPILKKASHTKNQEKLTRIPLIEENILSNLESPVSPSGRQYNLRRSRRLNSPLTSP